MFTRLATGFLVGLLWVVASASAQPVPGVIQGTVTDRSGGVVPGATVRVSRPDDGETVTVSTDASGRYTVTRRPGAYTLQIQATGFTSRTSAVRVTEGGTIAVDVVLEVGGFVEQTSAMARARAPRSELGLAPETLPAPVAIIDHAELDRTNVGQDVGTLFRRVPGVVSHNLNQGETGTAIKLRGFSSSTHGADVAAYVDGIPQNVPSSAINHGMNDMSWLTPDMIERVEVVKGPFSALFGDQNRSGAVNIVTRSSAASSVGATVGSFGTKRLSVVWSRPIAKARFLVVGDLFDVTGYRANAQDRRGTLFAKVLVPRGRAVWSARGNYYKADWDAPGFLNVASVQTGLLRPTDRDPTAPPLWGKADRASLVVTRAPSAGEAGLHVAIGIEDYARTRALGANATDYNVQMDDRRILQGRVVEQIVWGTRAALAIGAEVRHDRGDSINQRWPAGVPGATYSWNQDLDLWSSATFVQGQVKPMNRLKAIGGARYDVLQYDIANRKLPAASLKYGKGVATPRAGLAYTVHRTVEVFTNVGEGFRSPNQSEISPSGAVGPLGAAGGAPQGGLEVPKVRSFDVGITLGKADAWTLTAARYRTVNQNEILQVSPGVFDAVGDTTRAGWDVEGRFLLPGETSIYGSLSEITTARLNNPPVNTASLFLVPKHIVKAGVARTIEAGAGRVFLNLDGFYISGIPFYTGAPLQLSGTTRPYSRYDVRATYELGRLQYTVGGTFQPTRYISEPLSVIAAGVFYDPRPTSELSLSIRYRY